MAALLVIAASSCKKDKDNEIENDDTTSIITPTTTTADDGVFNPSKKIHKCYYKSPYEEEKELEEVWNWDGTKLASIDHYYFSGTVGFSEIFNYQNDQLAKVESSDDDTEYTTYTYNAKGKFDKVKACYYDDGDIEYVFSYGSDGRVSEINAVSQVEWFLKDFSSLASMWMPKQAADRLAEGLAKLESRRDGEDDGEMVIKITFTWEGNNIRQASVVTKVTVDENNYLDSNMSFSFNYDNKNNPKKGYTGLYFMDEYYFLYEYYSKNNINHLEGEYWCRECYDGELYEENDTQSNDFYYEYDEDGFPTMQNRDGSIYYFEYQ